jgi:hypothetical protein
MMRHCIFALFLLAAVPAFAEIKIFLYPRCEADGKSVRVEEIAWVEGDAEKIEAIKKILIDEKTYRDGFIDRRELARIFKDAKVEEYTIVGNSVRISKPTGDKAEKEKLEKLAVHAVKKGDAVKVLIKSNKITLEIHGTVAKEAFPGDEVTVDLDKKRSVRGILHEERTVEVKI